MTGRLMFPRPTYSGDYLAAGIRVGPGKLVPLNSGTDIITMESLPVPCGVYANQVYEVVWSGDMVITSQPADVYFRLAVSYGNGGVQNTAVVLNTWKIPAGIPSLPWPYFSAPFVSPADYDTVFLLAQSLSTNGAIAYGSAPGGQLFGIKAVGDTSTVFVVTS